jgi:hypothetical protein
MWTTETEAITHGRIEATILYAEENAKLKAYINDHEGRKALRQLTETFDNIILRNYGTIKLDKDEQNIANLFKYWYETENLRCPVDTVIIAVNAMDNNYIAIRYMKEVIAFLQCYNDLLLSYRDDKFQGYDPVKEAKQCREAYGKADFFPNTRKLFESILSGRPPSNDGVVLDMGEPIPLEVNITLPQ